MNARVNKITAGLEKKSEDAQEQALLDLLDLCKSARDAAALPGSIKPRLLEIYRTQKTRLFPAQQPDSNSWVCEEPYADLRGTASLVLDALGYFPGEDTEAELREALTYQDPRLKLFAITSLLKLGKEVLSRYVFEVAASPEMRNWLYERLQELGKEPLYPPSLKTQKAFAESNMVEWLVYPTELGCAPDEIELISVVDIGTDERPMDYYLFRFRTFPPHWAADKGWMAGLSGPFSRKDAPSTEAYGYTFSRFEPWDSKTPDEHIEATLQVLDEWFKRTSKTN